MHRVTFSLRHILPSELPTVWDAALGVTRPMRHHELLNIDIHHLHGNVYSCADQWRRDPDTLEWSVVGALSPGTLISEGSHRERHAQVPAEHVPSVFRARVIRSGSLELPVTDLVTLHLEEQARMLEEHVGDGHGVSLDPLTEAQRLADHPAIDVHRHTVPMAAVTAEEIVEQDRLPAHAWQGESLR